MPDIDLTKAFTARCRPDTRTSFTLLARNVGDGPTSGPNTVTDPMPAGLTLVSASGSGWDGAGSTPAQLLCIRNVILDPGAVAPPITVQVAVTAAAPAVLINTALAETAGDLDLANATADAACLRNAAPAPPRSPAAAATACRPHGRRAARHPPSACLTDGWADGAASAVRPPHFLS